MVELRPLIVVTGTVRAEGGETNTVRNTNKPKEGKTETSMVISVERTVSKDRRIANVITTDYMRKLRQLRLVKSPFGALISPKDLHAIKQLCADVGRKIAEYNKTTRSCVLTNCVLWENLLANRRLAVAGWIDARIVAEDEEVLRALPQLVVGAKLAA